MVKALECTVAGIRFRNPVTVASGTFGVSDEYAPYVDYERLGGIITKTITLKPRPGNPMPRIAETPGGMLNSIGLQNKGLAEFIEKKIPYFEKVRTNLIVNIAGKSVEEFKILARALNPYKVVKALEINLSCPNVAGGLDFSLDARCAAEVTRAVRRSSKKPFFAKLSPEASNLPKIARAVERAGADGVSLINTIRGMAIDVKTRKPKLARLMGGLSGPAIRPIAVRCVWEARQAIRIPILAMGGIMNAEDALEFFMAGADLVSIGTANFVDPRASLKVVDGLERYAREQKLKSLRDLHGLFLREAQER